MKNLYLISIILFCCQNVFPQEHSKIDSLKKLIEKEKDVAKKTRLFNLVGHLYDEQSELDSALHYYTAAKEFAIKNKYDIGVASFDFHAIMILNKKGKFKDAFLLAEESVEKFKKLKSTKNLGIAYLNLGNQWQYFSDFERASEYYLLAKNLLDSLQDKNNQRMVNNNLGSVFMEMKQFEKAKEYCLKAIELADREYPTDKLLPLHNLALNAKNQKKYEEALKYIEQYLEIAQRFGNEYEILNGYLAKGNLIGKTNLDKGINYLNNAIVQSQKNDFPEKEMFGYLYLAEIYIDHKKFRQALESIELGIPIAEELGMKYELSDFHKKASEAYEHLGNFEEALKHNREHEKLISEIQLEENKNRLLGLEAKYQSEKKEAEIKILNTQSKAQALSIRKKNTLNYIFFGAVLLIGIISILSYLNYKNRQKISQQRIQELETEKQLSATQALLQGQEDERSRMAKELHDGLGGLLSGVKLNLNNMQKKLIITEEDGNSFEKSITLLDESISELRRVAHNLMPESILKFGLDGAIREFLQSVDNENLKINYQSYHIENGINKQLDISTYRIIQELVNNAIKHSDASEILVQVRKDEHLLVIDVEDNGKGFDPDSIKKESGMGLTGIRSRINYWKGSLQIESTEKEGTSVNIEIPVVPNS
ncbi:tetratricopeptide repeat protein [Moheibacter sp.]|uniref:tetratricopeptide repeat protein n=1 Tax=Moheibacter sp. TaxID=1965316 RepID=UPI003C709FFE